MNGYNHPSVPIPATQISRTSLPELEWGFSFAEIRSARGVSPTLTPTKRCRSDQIRSDSANVLRLGTFLSLSRVILNRLPILQIAESVTDDIGVVTKEIFAPVFRCDESKTLLLTEPLDCTVGQTFLSLIISDTWRLLRAFTPLS